MSGYRNFVIGIQSNPASFNPDWVLFLLGNGPANVSMSFALSRDAFTYAALFAQVSPVPLPGAIWLMGTALLGGAGLLRWRRRPRDVTGA